MKSILFTALTTMCFATVTVAQTLPAYIPANGLVGWWPFNGNANDESGNNNNGTVNGSTLTNDRFGNANCAYNFNGSSNYIQLAPINGLNNISQLTISTWVKIDGQNTNTNCNLGCSQFIVNRGADYSSNNLRLGYGQGTLKFATGLSNTSGLLSAQTYSIPFQNWIHVVWVKTTTQHQLFINGQLSNSSNFSGLVPTSSDPVYFGYNPVSGFPYYLKGKLDDVGIWNRALTQCEIQDLFNAQVNSLTGISAGVDQTVCAGQSVTLSGSGASTYTWDNGITNGSTFTPFVTTMYTVTGTNASGCVGTDQVLVTVNPLPTIDPGFDLVVCEGEQITLTCTGADTYFWNNNVTNGVPFTPTHLGDEIFSVIATDLNGCSANGSVLVRVNENTSSTQTQTACSAFTLNNQTYTQTGVYTQQLTNSQGCDSTITLNLTILPLPSVAVTSSSGVLTANQQNATYQWLDCDNNYIPISGATFISFTPQISGNYAVEINQNSCIDTSQCYAVTVNSSGLSEHLISNEKLYPNPNDGSFYFESDKGGNYVITDGIGKVIYSFSIEKSNKKLITITNLPNGVYFIVPEGSNSWPMKLVIE